ncbi:MAG: hypothetical protein ACKPKO_15295, partial [Candidatus Fonsibacter sp.]
MKKKRRMAEHQDFIDATGNLHVGNAMTEPEPTSSVARDGGSAPDGDAMLDFEPATCKAGNGGADPAEEGDAM